MRVVQIVPEISTGTGVEAVAFHLEREWQAAGIETVRFTLADAAGGWLPTPGPGIRGKLTLIARVVWFSTVGTVLARRALAGRDAETVTICHNDALVGDVYVNHGIVAEAMRSRGHAGFRMVRNPLHVFTWVRDAARFARGIHGVVVNLTSGEETALRRTYPSLRPRTAVIGNGVDLERYQPDATARERVRAEAGLGPQDVLVLFVGHEFDRKGLYPLLEAVAELPSNVHLAVVGGTEDLVATARARATSAGLGTRARFLGRLADPRPWFHASDVFALPSAYESFGLVVLEALACGVPVVASPTGCVPDVIEDGVNGVVAGTSAGEIREGLERVLSADAAAMRAAARRSAERHSWAAVASRYVELFQQILEDRR